MQGGDGKAGRDARAFSLYTGCLIPSKFPFIEMASRRVLEALGLELHDIEGAGCCPNQMAIQSTDRELWLTIAARNLALAEASGRDVLSLCNGCYDTLKTVRSELLADDALRRRVNARLAELGLEFRGSVEVKHVVQVLRDDVGLNAIDQRVVRPLRGARLAAFAGCHVRRPGDHMGFDDPERPHYLGDILRAIGAAPVAYTERDSCCGGGFSIGRKDDVVPAARRVFRSAMGAGGAALVVTCPYCFAQFFAAERRIRDIYFEGLDMPVFYVTELVGLAMGLDPDELGLPLHYAASAGREREWVAALGGAPAPSEAFDAEVTRAQLETCRRCLACVDDCQTAKAVDAYRPEELVELVLQGRTEEALSREDLWHCINCHECVQRCPQGFGMVRLLVRLKNLATERGIRPEAIQHRFEELAQSGFSFAPDEGARRECGLGAIHGPEPSDIERLIRQVDKGGER